MNETTDEVLVERFQRDPESPAGQAAARELFERYRDRVFLWCARRVRDEEKALDLAQDVLVSAYRGLGGFESRARYSTWIYTIARNRCFRALRPLSLTRDDEADPDLLPAEDSDPAGRFEREQEESRLLSLMHEALEPREQQALAMRCFDRLSVDEITRRLDVAGASGARSLLQSARRKLRAALEQGAGEEGRS